MCPRLNLDQALGPAIEIVTRSPEREAKVLRVYVTWTCLRNFDIGAARLQRADQAKREDRFASIGIGSRDDQPSRAADLRCKTHTAASD